MEQINKCFPEEIAQYYWPGYSDTLLQRLDGHQQPQPATMKIDGQTTCSLAGNPRLVWGLLDAGYGDAY